MNNTISINRSFEVGVARLWETISQPDVMKEWYFDWADFKAQPGYRFTFTGGPSPERMYIHVCEVIEAIPENKLSYTWCYEGYSGSSLVTFLTTGNDSSSQLHFTHEGTETFPAENPDLATANFVEGWNHILNFSLKNYLETKK